MESNVNVYIENSPLPNNHVETNKMLFAFFNLLGWPLANYPSAFPRHSAERLVCGDIKFTKKGGSKFFHIKGRKYKKMLLPLII